MPSSQLIRWSGLSNMVAGASFIPYVVAATLFSLSNPLWRFGHVLGIVAVIFGLLGLVGLLARQVRRIGPLGLIGFVLLFIGNALFVGELFIDTFVVPLLAAQTPTLLAAVLSGWYARVRAFIGLSLLLGYLLFGIAIWRAGVLPRPAAVLLIIGALLFPPLLPDPIRIIGAVGLGVSFAWFGYALWMGQDKQIGLPKLAA